MLNYRLRGAGKDILFLHGWGQNLEMMEQIAGKLTKYRTLSLDMPGFGLSPLEEYGLSLQEYTIQIHRFLQSLEFVPSIVVGHSFGGKIAYLYAKMYGVKALILIAPSLIKPRFNFRVFYLKKKYQLAKKLGVKRLGKYGSKDYQMASNNMKRLLVTATNTYYDSDLNSLEVPTLLYFGKNDRATPIYMAKKIKRRLPNCQLVIHPHGDHYAYNKYPYHFLEAFNNFIEDKL